MSAEHTMKTQQVKSRWRHQRTQTRDEPEIYLHRIGRTARAGSQGVAVSLFTQRDSSKMQAIEAMTGAPIERIGPPSTLPGEPKAHRAAFATLLISGGRKDKLRPGDILGALTNDAGLLGSDFAGSCLSSLVRKSRSPRQGSGTTC